MAAVSLATVVASLMVLTVEFTLLFNFQLPRKCLFQSVPKIVTQKIEQALSTTFLQSDWFHHVAK